MDKSYWLFHFRLAGEKTTNSKKNAHGIGHAMRCLSIIDKLESSFNITALIVTNSSQYSKNFLHGKGRSFFDEQEINKVLTKYNVDLIVSDINYLEKEFVDEYEKHCSWACLAPRGETKYQSSLSFKDTLFNDIDPPPKSHNNIIFSGADYVVCRHSYLEVKEKLSDKKIIKDNNKIIISMGGVDHLDLTRKVLESLLTLENHWKIEVVLGPLYNNQESLEEFSKEHSCNVNIIRDPADIYINLATSNLGIFAAGIISYESAGLGTPCLNLSMSDFHKRRSKEIESLGMGIDLGGISSLSDIETNLKIMSLVEDAQGLDSMRQKGIKLVDGMGASRIVNELKNYLDLTS
ncbi:hypothetical protein N9S24_01750 [SAR86 cluster bacterium]|nr:hypothetical protein [SAR86 cluster bacterium]